MSDLTGMISFFDNLAANWDLCPQEYETREKITALAGFLPGSTLADIGCGRGVMFEHLLKTDPKEIFAVDVSGEMMKYAQASYQDSRLTFRNEDFLQAQLPLLDGAIIYNAYPHFLDKPALAQKLAQQIRPGGIFVIAHGRGRAIINGTHRGKTVSPLSTPLEAAETEAQKFTSAFSLTKYIDNDDFYFIKLLRK